MCRSRFATRADDSVLKALLRDNPMDAWVSLSMEREPSYFHGTSLMGKSYTLISEENTEVVGMYACSYLPVHINGKSETIGYFGSMRISKPFRNKIRCIKEGFDTIREQMPKEATVPFYFTSIASENLRARRLLEANVKGMPRYHPRGQMSTLIFSTKRAKSAGMLKQATKEDISDIVVFYNQQASKYQLSPYLSEAWLESLDGHIGLRISDFYLVRDDDGKLQGCLALWDQRAFKQSVVQGYRTPLKQMRPLYNLYARLNKQVELPACGEALQHLFVAFFAFKDDAAAIDLLKEAAKIAQQTKKVKSCVLGLSSKHPLLPALKRQLRPSVYLTEIETVVLDRVDADPGLDDRLIQPEVALL